MSVKTKEPVSIKFLAGPFSGRVHDLHENESVVIGRSSEADIVIPDSLLSRRHLKIYKRNDKWFLLDLESSNGTWVSGRKVSGKIQLESEDRIRLGNSLIEFNYKIIEKNRNVSDTVVYSFTPDVTNTARLNKSKEEALVPNEHRRLNLIYKIHSQLANVMNEKEVYSIILENLIEEIPSDSISLMLYDDLKDSFSFAHGIDRDRVTLEEYNHGVSSSVVEFVKKKQDAILSVKPAMDSRVASDTLIMSKPGAVMCVPIICQADFIGVLYASSRRETLDQDDLHLMAGVAGLTGMVLLNCRLIQKNLSNERMAALGMTAASLSHYIKNILTGIDGCLYLLRMGIDENDNELTNEAWGILSRNHKRLSGLVFDLLNLAKEDQLEFSFINVFEIIVEVIELVRTKFEGLNIKIEIDEELMAAQHLAAEADGMAIHRVLLNLMNNAGDALASRYVGEEGGVIKVSANYANRGQILEIAVEDNASGIEASKMDQIFEMFYTEKGEGGTGLGLAVSKRLIEAHKGVLQVESELQKFTRFTIKIPTNHSGTRLDLSADLI